MTTKHTPRPWKIERYTTKSGLVQTIIQAEKNNVCRMDIAGRDPRTLMADATVICLAPRLAQELSILCAAVEAEHGDHDPQFCAVCESLLNSREALSLATGKVQ